MNNSYLKYFALLVLALLAGTSCLWAQPIKGQVVDAETGEPLVGVAIEYNQSLKRGTVTDFDGNFDIPERRLIQKVIISYIGYQTQVFLEEEVPEGRKTWVINLLPSSETLQEVEVIAGENPALRIVRKAIKMRNENNPRKYKSYKYVSYNKDVISYKMELPDSGLTHKDSIVFARDTAKAKDRHLFVIESVTRKLHKAPHRSLETVVGTKISGFKHPSVAAIPDGIQNFGFHENIIPLVDKKFLNPLADGADRKYAYILRDTIYDGSDTIFVMDYFPERGANYEGFEGEMHIHTRKWALVKVTARPFDKGKINLNMQQDYQWIESGFWFPKVLEFEFDLQKVPFRKTGAVMHGKTYLDSVEVGLEIPDEIFSHIEVDIDQQAGYVNNTFWEQYRQEDLSLREQETYRQMDSVGDRYHFDAVLNGTRHIYDGYIAVGALDVEMNKLIAYNDYEGLRLGIGLYTNDVISEKFQVGGYVGHGANDKQWKYGGRFRWYFDKPNDFFFTASYSKDVRDPGGIRLKYKEWGSFSQQFFNKLMDQVEEASFDVTYRAGRYSKFKVGMRHFAIRPTYDYQFSGFEVQDPQQNIFRFTEAQIWYRWQYKEKFSRNYGQRISQGSKWPILNVIYSRGLEGTLNGQFNYNKVELGIFYSRYIKNLGKFRIAAEFGLVDRAVPWSMNFSGRPSYNPSFSIVVRETFQTMRFNEFSSDRYFSLFFQHDFGPLLLRHKKFKPRVILAHAMGFGTLSNPEFHQGVPFKTLENGFFESGIILHNLVRINFFNAGYIGFGGGLFYRYGANHLPVERENWTFKLAVMYSVN